MAERLRTWAERYFVAGAAVAWMRGDERASAATGVVNNVTGVEATPDTLFQIGSITKVYTTTLIMQLADAGALDIDAPAVKYLPTLRFADAAATRAVTIRHLLTHTSGVDGDFFDDFGRGDDSVTKYVDACSRLPFVFPTGTMWSYCNAGFVVLGRIVEVLTGMTWGDALRQRVLAPIGADSTVTRPEDALLHRTAAGHMVDLQRQVRRTPVWAMSWSQGPAGATPCSTVDDMLTFAKMHIDGGVARDSTRLLSESAVREMQRPQVDLPDEGYGAAHWGLGWMLFNWGAGDTRRRIIGHDGGTIGQISSLRVLPDERFAVAVLTNTSPTGTLLAERIMRWLFGEAMGIEMPARLRPPEQPAQLDLAPYIGVYERTSLRVEITQRDGRLYASYKNTGALAPLDEQGDMPPMPLIPVDASKFVQEGPIPGVCQPVTFSQFEAGKPRYFIAGRVARRAD
jgi:CubicO group peptidase (beta-lactamase class C family)